MFIWKVFFVICSGLSLYLWNSWNSNPVTNAFVTIKLSCESLRFYVPNVLAASSLEAQRPASRHIRFQTFKRCAINNFLGTGLPFLDNAAPLPSQEFIERRDRLAAVLAAEDISAFLTEPGYAFQYYANVSQRDWEPWEPEERPFLIVIKPRKDNSGKIRADTWFLAPEFEAERVRLLQMPVVEPLQLVTWKEHWNPYKTLFASDAFRDLTNTSKTAPKIMVDEEIRDFIQRGLNENGFDVVGLGQNVERIRQTKSQREISILRAVNTGTVEAVRQMRKCLHIGLSENEVRDALDETLSAGGLKPFFDIVLFDDDASNPHGGTRGKKKLDHGTLVLIDVGAHLYGYSSDISRTFFPPYVSEPTNEITRLSLSQDMKDKIKVWDIVFEAQSASLRVMKQNHTASDVDLAARRIISNAGYGNEFTHRVGHGIGIKAHESPYLHKGNVNTSLYPGMVFTSEPGVYLVEKFGVRHEDVFLVKEDDEPEVLSGERARGPWDP